MPIGTIKIAVNDKGYPVAGIKEGKPSGYAMSADTGQFISIRKELVDDFRKGGTIRFEFETFGRGGKIATKILDHTVGTAAPTPPPSANGAALVRPRTSKEDEEQVNRRHRLTWIGERLDAVAASIPLNYEQLRPVAQVWADIYDSLATDEPSAEPDESPDPDRPMQAAYATGPAPGKRDDMDDSIPF